MDHVHVLGRGERHFPVDVTDINKSSAIKTAEGYKNMCRTGAVRLLIVLFLDATPIFRAIQRNDVEDKQAHGGTTTVQYIVADGGTTSALQRSEAPELVVENQGDGTVVVQTAAAAAAKVKAAAKWAAEGGANDTSGLIVLKGAADLDRRKGTAACLIAIVAVLLLVVGVAFFQMTGTSKAELLDAEMGDHFDIGWDD